MHRPRRSRTSTSKFRPSFRVLIRQSLTRVTPTLMLPSGRQRHRILLPDSLRTSQNTKATQLVRLWLLQVRRLNRPTLRKTRDLYPNIKKAVRSGFIPGGQPSSFKNAANLHFCEPSLHLTTVIPRIILLYRTQFPVKRKNRCLHLRKWIRRAWLDPILETARFVCLIIKYKSLIPIDDCRISILVKPFD